MKKYTVVGMYADNQQPWVQHVKADDPQAAAAEGCRSLMTDPEVVADEDNLFVVEVFEGHHMGCLGNEAVESYQDLASNR